MNSVICIRCESVNQDPSENIQIGCAVCRDVACIGCYDGVGTCVKCNAIYSVKHEDKIGGSCSGKGPMCPACLIQFGDVLDDYAVQETDRKAVLQDLQEDLDEIVRRNAWRIKHRQGVGNSAMSEYDMVSSLLMTAVDEYEVTEALRCYDFHWMIDGRIIVDDRSGRWKDLKSGEENVGVLTYIVHLGYAEDEETAWDYGVYIGTICECVDAHKKTCRYPTRINYPPLVMVG